MHIWPYFVIFLPFRSLLEATPLYGEGAAFPCRCTGDCDPDTGRCLAGECQDGLPTGYRWGGEGCRVGNVALRKPATQVATWKKWKASYAVNGDPGPERAQCAYVGSYSIRTAWWYVDLGKQFKIFNVTVYNMDDQNYDLLQNFGIHVGNEIRVANNPLCDTIPGVVPRSRSVNLVCDSQPIGRYVGYRSHRTGGDARWATLCEVVVIGRSVVDCSMCPNSSLCDDYHGCRQCNNGSVIPDCKTKCLAGRYGLNCQENCSIHCKDHPACNRTDGMCLFGCTDIHNLITDEWWIGGKCDVYIPTVPYSPLQNITWTALTTTTVTVQWADSLNIARSSLPYFGFNIYISNASTAWTLHGSLHYDTGAWKNYSLKGLEPASSYLVAIFVYRIYTNGTQYQTGAVDYPTHMINVTTLSLTTDGLGRAGGVSVGIIVGPVVVFVALLLLAVLIAVVVVRRRKGRTKADNDPADFANSGYAEPNKHRSNNIAGDKHKDLDEVSTHDEDKDPIYENARRSLFIASTSVKVKGYETFLVGKKGDHTWFKKEFDALPEGQVLECKAGSKPNNIVKNRFVNIKPYDATIIELDVDGDKDSSYINANFITGFGGKGQCYAATQGPKPETVTDFWRMIWKLQSSRIVMLTELIETGKNKSAMYWPEGVGMTKLFGVLKVTTISSNQYADYAHRVFRLEKEGLVLSIHHFQYLHWPDKSVPKETFPLISLRNVVRSMDDQSTGPLVIHCSAGVGRTGTFIAIDFLIEQAETDKEVDVVKLATQMRLERMLMIQTLSQYVFVYDAILEATTCGRTAISVSAFEHEYSSLNKPDNTELDEQFGLLSKLTQAKSQLASEGMSPENMLKNRDASIIPNDSVRPYLTMTSEFRSGYINAVFVNSFKVKHGMIATQTPLAETVVDFWRLVYDHNCSLIVNMDTNQDATKAEGSYFEDVQNVPHVKGPFEITMECVKAKGALIIRKFRLIRQKKPQKERIIKLVHFSDWHKSTDLPNKKYLLDLFDYIDSINLKDKLLIHCLDGASRCGLFCAARYMLEKMSVEKEVDVFMAVRYVSSVRSQFVESKAQYRFLHELALEHNSRFDTYENI